ncbi:MAG TPA: hypothetical protein VFG50_11935 [Rhodothermales bacterium]|nr:hypothetical protein [Rhodothermales bacterium]
MADVYSSADSDAASDGGSLPEPELGPDVTPDDLYLSEYHAESDLDLTGFQREVVNWIRENQAIAMIGGFAVGVFLGVMLRD